MDQDSNNEVSSAVERLLSGAIDKVKARAQETEKAHLEAVAKFKTQAQAQAKAHAEQVANINLSTKIDGLLADALAKQKARLKAEFAETTAQASAQAEEKAREYADEITKVRADSEQTIAQQNAQAKAAAEEAIAQIKAETERTIAEEKSKAQAETAQAKAEVEEKAKAFIDTANGIKAEAEQAIQMVKAEAEETIAKVRVQARHAVAKVRAHARSSTAGGVVPGQPVMAVGSAQGQPVSAAIARMGQSPANLPGEHPMTPAKEYAGGLSAMCAADVMQKETVWANPDDSVQQALDKLQQNQASYLMVGRDNMLEGIVSKSDLTGAISPYLRPMFAKWRRPLDDATLQIRIKWIMSRPVHTIRPDTPVLTIMNHMRQFNVLCLPVVDAQGKVQGAVLETSIFKTLLKLKNSAALPASAHAAAQQPQPAGV
ncbi:MAG TPA: CBS domain-containing protein [Sedimentisphaerales bacterium]|nr:CBS domain-containing protein [Sedimentisphaerales bacterium]